MYSLRFIVIEGLEGSGKSTLAANLDPVLSAQAMAKPSHHVAMVRKFFDRARSPYSRCYCGLSADIGPRCLHTVSVVSLD